MLKKFPILNYPHIDKIVFALSVLVGAFWYGGQYINVYRVPAVGVLFELAWLPMVALLIILPVLSILLLIKEKFSFKSLALYSLLLLLGVFLLLNFKK
jgi:hypothetical protein